MFGDEIDRLNHCNIDLFYNLSLLKHTKYKLDKKGYLYFILNHFTLLSFKFGKIYDFVITVFVNSLVENYKYLYSFVETEDYVFDFSHNLKMQKDDFYTLLDLDVVSKIDGSRLIDDVLYVPHNYLSMILKEFLVRHDELVKRR